MIIICLWILTSIRKNQVVTLMKTSQIVIIHMNHLEEAKFTIETLSFRIYYLKIRLTINKILKEKKKMKMV